MAVDADLITSCTDRRVTVSSSANQLSTFPCREYNTTLTNKAYTLVTN